MAATKKKVSTRDHHDGGKTALSRRLLIPSQDLLSSIDEAKKQLKKEEGQLLNQKLQAGEEIKRNVEKSANPTDRSNKKQQEAKVEEKEVILRKASLSTQLNGDDHKYLTHSLT